MIKPLKFKLQNGLAATLYPPENPNTKQLLKKFEGKDVIYNRPSALSAVKVIIGNERVYLLYLATTCRPAELLTELAGSMNDVLGFNYAIIYNQEVHFWKSDANHALANAVAQNVKPCLAMLLA